MRELHKLIVLTALATGCAGEVRIDTADNPALAPDGTVIDGDPATSPGDALVSVGGGRGGDIVEPVILPDDAGANSMARITRQEYFHNIRELFGATMQVNRDNLPPDVKVAELFDSNEAIGMSEADLDAYWAAGEAVAQQLDPDELCDPDGSTAECVNGILDTYGERIFRRPVADAARDAFVAHGEAIDQEGSTRAEIVHNVVTTLLNTPEFLYHVERVPDVAGVHALDGHAVADRLARFLWLQMPDEELLRAARTGELATSEGIEAQARRMLADERSDRAMRQFHVQWLGVDRIGDLGVDPEVFGEFDGLRGAMQREVFDFAVEVGRSGSYSDLFAADYTVIASPQLANFYGVTPTEDGRVEDLPNRRGILTAAGVLAAHGYDQYTQPIFRGLFLRRNVLCHSIELPDAGMIRDIDEREATFTDDMSDRHKLEALTSGDCQGCHAAINPPGYAFEMYDAIGGYRDVDTSGQPIDTTVTLTSFGIQQTDVDGEYASILEMTDAFASSETVQQCYARQWFRYATGRTDARADEKAIVEAAGALETDSIHELLVAIATSYAFTHRRVEAE